MCSYFAKYVQGSRHLWSKLKIKGRKVEFISSYFLSLYFNWREL